MANPTDDNALLPQGPTGTTSGAQFDTLNQYSLAYGNKALEAINGRQAPTVQNTVALPVLTESLQQGYTATWRNGVPTITGKTITCCAVGGVLMEKNTAYDFILMRNAAAFDKIELPLIAGYRTMAQQTALYEERKNPAIRAVQGQAAYPGSSNHQTGIALDIDVGIDIASYLAGKTTARFEWLTKYGASFGFDHVEGHAVHEAWHWTHLPTTVVGSLAYASATGMLVLNSSAAVGAAASGQWGTARIANREGYDDTTALARASTLPQCSRQAALAEWSLFNANTRNFVSWRTGQLQTAQTTLVEVPKGFAPENLAAFSYNFTTGLWGDGGAV